MAFSVCAFSVSFFLCECFLCMCFLCMCFLTTISHHLDFSLQLNSPHHNFSRFNQISYLAMTHNLYGGAVEVSLPSGLVDVSTFRDVPDTQEVFVQEKGQDPTKDISIIFDLLEAVDASSWKQALEVHAKELGLEIPENQVFETWNNTLLNTEVYASIYFQESPKKDKLALATVLGLIRLTRVETDVLVTVNVPMEFAKKNSEESWPSVDELRSSTETRFQDGYLLLQNALTSYQVKNWGLFG